jgi:N-methylhydantoinase A
MSDGYRLGVDVGGTFTDIVVIDSNGSTLAKKVLSTPPEFNRGIRTGIEETLGEFDIAPEKIQEYVHGATVCTNAIITRSGAVTGLITTAGFRDVLEIRRMRLPWLYDISWEKPEPLVPRQLRLEVAGRMSPSGTEVEPLDEQAARQALKRLIDSGVESVGVCFLHSYANDAQERRLREIAEEIQPNLFVSLSSEILPEIKEYERTSTLVINSYLLPVVQSYFSAMEADLELIGLQVPIMVMQSNGGMMPSTTAGKRPILIVESGPAAGVTGCYHLAKKLGLRDVITFDMGGTTAKAGVIEDGEIMRCPEYEVGGEISIGHRLMKGSGYLLRVPSVDLAEVGAGGGSIAWLDGADVLKVGPKSAGADPGPACYDRGGQEPTITDANVVLGFTNPESLAGGSLKINPELANKVIKEKIADRLGVGVAEAALGIRTVANSSIIRALRAVSTERGRDPKRFDLFGFGGMGPTHVVDLAESLGIQKIIIPPLPGVFSSLGLLFAAVEHHLIQTYYADTVDLDFEKINGVLERILQEASTVLDEEGYPPTRQELSILTDVRYFGQDYALTVSVGGHSFSEAVIQQLIEDYHREHESTYGYRSDKEHVQIVALRCVAKGDPDESRVPAALRVQNGSAGPSPTERKVFLGPKLGWGTVPVINRNDLDEKPQDGCMIIEEDNSLTVVNAGWKVAKDHLANIVIQRRS